MAFAHLSSVGCSRFAILSHGSEALFRAAVTAHGGKTCDAWIETEIPTSTPGAALAAAERVWSAKPEKPDGLVILDDTFLAEAQLVFLREGVKVPESLKLAVAAEPGAHPACPFPFTALATDTEAEARVLVDALFRRIHGEVVEPCNHVCSFRLEPVGALAMAI